MENYEEAVKGLVDDAEKAAGIIRGAKDVLIVSHIDADGISSAAIAIKTCQRLGIPYKNVFAKKMDEKTIKTINESKESVVWVVDLGSGYISQFTRNGIVVTDHHAPDMKTRTGQMTFDTFVEVHHVNPHLWEIDGTTDASGSSMTYLVAKSVNPRNTDMAFLAIVGSSGDLQDMQQMKLVGLNRLILQDAIEDGDVICAEDLRLFGKETRNLVQFLQYSNEPEIPGLSDNWNNCVKFFEDLGINTKNGNKNRVWTDLTSEEKEKIVSKITELVDRDKIVGEVYYLPKFKSIPGLGEAKEFATVLNSCGRYDDCETGVKICFGDKDAVSQAIKKREDHRKNISNSITFVRNNCPIQKMRFIQYFSAGTGVQETVVGIIAGILLKENADLPIFGMVETDDGIKISARADNSFIARGLNLSKIMAVAAENVGGFGGGHTVAAGATIPKGKEKEFLTIAEAMVASQVN